MAFELIAGERRRPRKAPGRSHVSVSASVEADALVEILTYAEERQLARSTAISRLIEAGLLYEMTIAPEQRRRADEAQNLAKMFGEFETKWEKFVDIEENSFYPSGPGNEHRSSVEVEVV